MKAAAWLACAGTAGIAGWLYFRTLLPGLDLGDTASFQTIATLPLLVPRHAYPLYFALAKVTLLAHGGEPAAALNGLSAVVGAAAAGAFTWLLWQLTRHSIAAFWAGLLLAGSYTFWSQALIAEVYTLHVLFIALVLTAAMRWWQRPTLARLAVLYAVYAVSFGNHLSMILLAPSLLWILVSKAHGLPARQHPFRGRGLALAVSIACVGALQYTWNLAGFWLLSAPRPPIRDLAAIFWFDTTKADWRESLVGTVPTAQLADRAAMYCWDLQQQFGLAGIALAVVGALALARSGGRIGGALAIAYVTTLGFAFFYNVGDTHVFLLPSHVIVALAAGIGVALLLGAARTLQPPWRIAVAALLLVVPIVRMVETAPAVDRSGDNRAVDYAAWMTSGLRPDDAVMLVDLNWQLANAVAYYGTIHRPELPRTHPTAVLWRLPALVRRNHDLERDIVMTSAAAAQVAETYGALFPITEDLRLAVPTTGDVLRVTPGTPYVLTRLTGLPGFDVDGAEFEQATRRLAGRAMPPGRYAVMAGRAGSPASLVHGADRPFRLVHMLDDMTLEVRIDSWIPFDTMRRAGFGHAIVNRRHVLTIERGVSLAVLDEGGSVQRAAYAGGIFAPQRRYIIPVLR